MDTITVKKSELLEALKENKDLHKTVFDKAQRNFRIRVIEELDQRLTDAQEGRNINLSFSFPEPENHTKDYDRVIRMVEMSQDDTLEITQADFARYVMDDWDWRRAWVANTLSYTQ